MEEEGLGWRFWGFVFAIVIGGVAAAMTFFLLFGWAWATFGFIGAFAILGAILIGIGYVWDRREERRHGGMAV